MQATINPADFGGPRKTSEQQQKAQKSDIDIRAGGVNVDIAEATRADVIREAKAKADKAEADAAAAQAGVPTAVQQGKMNLTPGQQKVDENFAPEYNTWVSAGGYADTVRQLRELDTVISELESGKQLSGAIVGRLPPLVQQILYGDDPKNIKATVDKLTVSSLRQILGAQFTKEEGQRIQEMSYDPTVSEASNIAKIKSSVRELLARAKAKQASADYFGKNGTLAGYTGPMADTPGEWDNTLLNQADKTFADLYGEEAAETPFETIERVKPLTDRGLGAGETYVSAEAKRLAADLDKAWREGATVEEIIKMNPGIDRGALEKAEEYRNQKPPVYARFAPYATERTEASKKLGEAFENPVVGRAMALAATSAPSYALDEIAGLMGNDPEATRFAMDYLGQKYPLTSAVGTFGGDVLRSVGGAKALEALGMRALPAVFASETGMGAVRGAFEAPEGQRLAGTLIGAGEGAVIGSLPSAAERALRPRTPDSVKLMRESGVDMSVGQTLGMPNLEATIARVAPGGGDVALAAQKQSMDDFQRAYLDEAGKFIGAAPLAKELKPTARFGTMQKAFNDAYDAAKSNMRVARDPEFDQAVADFRARLRDGVSFDPANAKRLEKLLDNTLVRKISASPTGDTYKSLDSLFGKRRASFSKAQNSELADGVAEMENILRGTALRNSPPEAIKALDDVDTGYSYLIRAEEAAKKTSTPAGEFSPQQLLSAVQRGDLTARNRAFARGEARGQDFAQKGVEALGEGTTSPTGLERILGIGATGTMLPIIPNVTMGVANAPGVRPFLNTMIAGERPEILREVGEIFAESPYVLSAPISGGTQAIQSIADMPLSSEELLDKYGYREQPIEPNEPLVGPELSEMQRRYAEQRLRQSAVDGEEMVPVQQAAPAAAAPAAQAVNAPIDLATEGRYDPQTDTYILPDGTRVDSSGKPIEMACGGPVKLRKGGQPKKQTSWYDDLVMAGSRRGNDLVALAADLADKYGMTPAASAAWVADKMGRSPQEVAAIRRNLSGVGNFRNVVEGGAASNEARFRQQGGRGARAPDMVSAPVRLADAAYRPQDIVQGARRAVPAAARAVGQYARNATPQGVAQDVRRAGSAAIKAIKEDPYGMAFDAAIYATPATALVAAPFDFAAMRGASRELAPYAKGDRELSRIKDAVDAASVLPLAAPFAARGATRRRAR